jgi:hypothetical protein
MESVLVRFPDRPGPLVDPPWAQAGNDLPSHGAALDRLYGAPDGGHILEGFSAAPDPIALLDDPLVVLANLIEGVSLPTDEPLALPMPEVAALHDFAPGIDAFHLHDAWSLDSST